MPQGKFDFEVILRTLKTHEVDFIVIGGVCALMHGAAITTFDLDIVHNRAEDNLKKLESALQELRAYYREHPPGRILPEAQRLNTPGHHLLMTTAGPMDVLGTVSNQRDYNQLLPYTREMRLDTGETFHVLTLPMLIQLKTEAGRQKDKAVLPILRAALEEQRRLAGETGATEETSE